MNLLVLGNSGAGKTTLARRAAERFELTWLDLDTIVFDPDQPGVLRPVAAVIHDLAAFVERHPRWVIEGSYGTWADHLRPFANRLVWLDPPLDTCLQHHASRPWEPHKYADPAEQERNRAFLDDWVRQYPTRDDTYGQQAHQRVFDQFTGLRLRTEDAATALDWCASA